MNKYKVCVYAIAKNEEQFVDRWMRSVQEADDVYVLDTGSTDDTVLKLKELGANVISKKINPWRFDTARNESLKLVPDDFDICVCLDLDEIIESGWREKLEELWNKNVTRIRYNYNWSFDKYGKPAVNFYIEKIHSRHGYKWVNPVHEILYCDFKEKKITTDEITVNHFPDKKKSRSSYLPLLELSVKENPLNDRNMHYLGREYMYYGRYNEAIDVLLKHLSLETATWKDERCASMRFIARCYKSMNRVLEARMWLLKAKEEAPYLREPYVELAILEYEEDNYSEASKNLAMALENKKYKSYINEPYCYDATIYDLLAVCKYYEEYYAEAHYYVKKALEIDPENERINNNKKIIMKKL